MKDTAFLAEICGHSFKIHTTLPQHHHILLYTYYNI